MSKKGNPEEIKLSAIRLRQIRENAGLTQEQFSEILNMSLSAYKKVESGENQISLETLRNLYKRMRVSADFVLFGEKQVLDETWEAILNCSESDKMFLLLRLLVYFTKDKKEIFPLKEGEIEIDKYILQILSKWQNGGDE